MGRKKGMGVARAEHLMKDWDDYFGRGTLQDWQRLCHDLDLGNGKRSLGSKTKCRKALRSVHVNIRQFLEASERPEDVRFFRNVHELREYTRENHYFFPRSNIPKGSPLAALLRILV